jgi:chromosome segregation ATPase
MEELKVLQDRVAELELQLEEANNKNASLNSLLESVTKANSECSAENENLKSQLTELQAEVEKLRDKNAKFENPSFTLDGVEYELLAKKANVPGHGQVTAADMVASEEIQRFLVERQSGLIRKKA